MKLAKPKLILLGKMNHHQQNALAFSLIMQQRRDGSQQVPGYSSQMIPQYSIAPANMAMQHHPYNNHLHSSMQPMQPMQAIQAMPAQPQSIPIAIGTNVQSYGMQNFPVYSNFHQQQFPSTFQSFQPSPPPPPMVPQCMPPTNSNHFGVVNVYPSAAVVSRPNSSFQMSARQYAAPKLKPVSNGPTQPSSSNSKIWYCEPCDKEMPSLSAYNTHCASHEKCRFSGCEFSGTKKVVIAHFHSAHGLYSGSGYKTIDVEGQKFTVLLGTSPEEVEQWRAERKKKFPSAENVSKKAEMKNELIKAGGIPNEKKRSISKKLSSNGKGASSEASNGAPATHNDGSGLSPPVGDSHANEDPANALASSTTPDQDGASVKVNKKFCVFFANDKCRDGDGCKYSHAFTPQICTYFVERGRCSKGNKCIFKHDRNLQREHREKSKLLKQNKKAVDNETEGGMEMENKADSAADATESKKPEKRNKMKKGNTDNEDENNAKNDFADDFNQPLIPKKKKQKGDLNIPEPYQSGTSKGSLLRRLLLDEVQSEENLILQSLRLFTQNNFFQLAIQPEQNSENHATNVTIETSSA